ATYAGPDAKAVPGVTPPGVPGQPMAAAGDPAVASNPMAAPVEGMSLAAVVPPPPVAVAPPAAPAGPTPFQPAPGSNGHGQGNGHATEDGGEEAAIADADLDDDDLENSLSLAAIEAELKPKVLDTFDKVADTYKRLRRLQDQDIENKLRNQSLSPAQERKYKKLTDELIAEVKSLRLNQQRIDALVEQLYDINKRLVSYEGRLMRLAESHGVSREDFL